MGLNEHKPPLQAHSVRRHAPDEYQHSVVPLLAIEVHTVHCQLHRQNVAVVDQLLYRHLQSVRQASDQGGAPECAFVVGIALSAALLTKMIIGE